MGSKKKETLIQFNRSNIIESAKQLFKIKGVEQTTMDDIAKEADYSKSTIYVYFKSKDEIYNSIACEYMNLLKEGLENCTIYLDDFEACYYKICNTILEFQEQFPLYFETLIGEINVDPIQLEKDSVLKEIYNTGEEINDIITKLLQFGIDHQFIRKDIELIPTVFYLWSGISGIVLLAQRKKKYLELRMELSLEDYLNYSFKMLLKSIIN